MWPQLLSLQEVSELDTFKREIIWLNSGLRLFLFDQQRDRPHTRDNKTL